MLSKLDQIFNKLKADKELINSSTADLNKHSLLQAKHIVEQH